MVCGNARDEQGQTSFVMAGLDPAIHACNQGSDVDARVKPGMTIEGVP